MIESKRGQYKSDNNRSNDKKKSCDNNHMTLLTINFKNVTKNVIKNGIKNIVVYVIKNVNKNVIEIFLRYY